MIRHQRTSEVLESARHVLPDTILGEPEFGNDLNASLWSVRLLLMTRV